MALKQCKKNFSRNPVTKRCRKKCIRVPSGRCQVLKPCRAGYSRNVLTNRCRKIVTSKKISQKASRKKTSSIKVSSRTTPAKKSTKTPRKTTPKKTSTPKTSSKTPRKTTPKTSSTPKTTWKDMIRSWKIGRDLPKITSGVYWETSSIHSNGDSIYREKQTRTSQLPMTLPANPAAFASHLQGKNSPVGFENLGKDAVLVSPPNKGLNYSHIGTFHKNASQQDIKAFWKKVAIEVEKYVRNGTKAYVSTHGTNVHWLHVRIEKNPKYYTSSLKNT